MWLLTQQNYIITIPNKGSQIIDSPASTFEGLRYRDWKTGKQLELI